LGLRFIFTQLFVNFAWTPAFFGMKNITLALAILILLDIFVLFTIFEFAKVSNISVEKVLRLIKESGGRVKLDPHKPNFLILQTGKIGLKEKSQFIREKLEFLL
jgi:transcription-repair coupling factor (superfamily II helicase)